jgi:hypothetical protein
MRVRVLLFVLGIGSGACSGSGTTDAGADSADVVADVVRSDGPETGLDVASDVPVDAVSESGVIDVIAEPPACAVACGDFRCLRCELGCCVELRDAGTDIVASDADAASASCGDGDGDGYGVGAGCAGPDCDDADPLVHPGASQRCNGLDNDCDGMVDQTAADARNADLDAWCASHSAGGYTLPPICLWPMRPNVTIPMYTAGMIDYVRTAATHCQACNRNSSGTWTCTCWDPQSPASGEWDCSTRP